MSSVKIVLSSPLRCDSLSSLFCESTELKEFPYAEHYSLVNDHLRILTAQEEAAPNEMTEESSDNPQHDAKTKSGVACADDQEWSDNEEEEEEGEETGMIVDAAS